MGAAVADRGPASPACGCGAAPGGCGCADKGYGFGAASGGCGYGRGAKATPEVNADAQRAQRPPRGTPQTAARRGDGPRQAQRSAQPDVQGDESAAAARRRAFLEQELPELWPTQESMDEAAGLRALARRLSAQLEAQDKRPKPVQVPRGAPVPVIERGQMPQPEPLDCGVGLKAPRFGLRSGPLRRGKMPKRPRKVVTYMFPRLRGGMQVQDGELLTGLRSLRGALARGLVPQIDLACARRPVMMEGPPGPSAPPSVGALNPAEVFRPGVVDLPTLASPSVRLRYRSTAVTLPSDWVMAYLAEYIETRGTVPHDSFDGNVAGAGVVLDVYWPRFRSRVVGLPQRRTAYGRLIGCWMLPYTAEEGMPTSLFFQTAGEQRAMHDLTLQMLHAYLPYAVVPVDNRSYPFRKLVDDDGWCDGLANFIRGMLEGEPRGVLDDFAEPFPNLSRSACSEARINYADGRETSLHAGEVFTPPCLDRPGYEDWVNPRRNEDGSKGPLDCNQSYSFSNAMGGSLLLPWDQYSLQLEIVPSLGGSYVWYADALSPASALRPWPKSSDVDVTAAAVRFRSVNFQPAHLAFDAEICDLLMFMSQICLDRYRALVRAGPGNVSLKLDVLDAGRSFSKYALALVASRAALLTHEFGHVYLGGVPHCGFHLSDGVEATDGRARWRACFDVASRFVWSRMAAENGLPVQTYVSSRAATATSLSVGDPDFAGEQNPTSWTLQNPVWVTTPPMMSGQNCEALRFGSEDPPSPWWAVSGFDLSASACVGSAEVTFKIPGDVGGGFEFRSSNGCNCMAAAVVPAAPGPLGGSLNWSASTPCFTSNRGLFGVYDAAQT